MKLSVVVALVALCLALSVPALASGILVQTNGLFIEAQENNVVFQVGTGGVMAGYKFDRSEDGYIIAGLGNDAAGTYVGGYWGKGFDYQEYPFDGRLGVLVYPNNAAQGLRLVAGIGISF